MIPKTKKTRSRCQGRIFYPTLTPEVQLKHILHRTPKSETYLVPVEMVQFPLKLLLKQGILAVHRDFQGLLAAIKLLTAKLHSRHP